MSLLLMSSATLGAILGLWCCAAMVRSEWTAQVRPSTLMCLHGTGVHTWDPKRLPRASTAALRAGPGQRPTRSLEWVSEHVTTNSDHEWCALFSRAAGL